MHKIFIPNREKEQKYIWNDPKNLYSQFFSYNYKNVNRDLTNYIWKKLDFSKDLIDQIILRWCKKI